MTLQGAETSTTPRACPDCGCGTLLLIYPGSGEGDRLWFCIECGVRSLYVAGLIRPIPAAKNAPSHADMPGDRVTVMGRVLDAVRHTLDAQHTTCELAPGDPLFSRLRVTDETGQRIPIATLWIDFDRYRAAFSLQPHVASFLGRLDFHFTVDLEA